MSMKSGLIIVMLILASPVTLILAEDVPEISCNNAEYRFEDVPANRIKHTFRLLNKGRAELKISDIRACCGSMAKIDKKNIVPGGEAQLELELFLEGRSGEIKKTCYVISNDPKQPYFPILITGNVEITKKAPSLIVTDPDELDLGMIRNDASITRHVRLVASTNVNFNISDIIHDKAKYDLTVTTQAVGRAYDILFAMKPFCADGAKDDLLIVHTDLPAMKEIKIPVRYYIFKDLVVVPGEVLLSSDLKNTPLIRYMSVKSRTRQKFKILEVKTLDPKITTSVTEMGDFGYRIELGNIMPFAEINSSMIIIKTNHNIDRELSVPFRVVNVSSNR